MTNSVSLYSYLYQPLSIEEDEIRLLHLRPNQHPDGRLQGHLEVVRLDEVPQFQSLSYVWGQSSVAKKPLDLSGQGLEITSNLEGALRAVRQRNVPLPLWCDRVCINQDDLEERNHQVHLMRRIFVSTTFVNIWLGPEFPGAKEIFTTLSRLANDKAMLSILQHRPDNTAVNHIKDMIRLFEYPWWQRLWTIQEALLAKRALMQCGSCMIDLETIMQAFELLWNQLMQQALPLQQLCGAEIIHKLTRQLEVTVRRLHVTRSLILSRPRGEERKFRDDLSKWPMVMHTCAWSNATDPRDKIYGTLGLFPSSFLEVDYSLTLQQTYARSTIAMIKRLSSLSVLTQTVSRVSIDNGLPSWVPDWRYPAKETASLLVFYTYFQAEQHIPLDAELLDDESLELSAQYIDEVVETGEIYDDGSSETIAELTPLLRPTIQSWLRLADVPDPDFGSFSESFTEPDLGRPTAIFPAKSMFEEPSQLPRGPTLGHDGRAYMAAQSYSAPVYKDGGYEEGLASHNAQQALQQAQQQRILQRARQQANAQAVQLPQSRCAPVNQDATYPHSSPSSNESSNPAMGPGDDGGAYQPVQSKWASVYKDKGYQAALAPGQQAAQRESMMYMPQQSQYGPVYRDAAYSQSSPNSDDTSTPAIGPRTYDPFTHTYGQGSSTAGALFSTTIRHATDSGSTYFDDTPASEVFWRTLCMDIVEDSQLKLHRRCKTTDSWRFWEWLDWVFHPKNPTGSIPQLHWHLTTQLQGKRLVKTKSGYLGLAGRDAQVGDQVWTLAGGAYPYVLRPDDGDAGGDGAFVCVSTAYVHGLMDGAGPVLGAVSKLKIK